MLEDMMVIKKNMSVSFNANFKYLEYMNTVGCRKGSKSQNIKQPNLWFAMVCNVRNSCPKLQIAGKWQNFLFAVPETAVQLLV